MTRSQNSSSTPPLTLVHQPSPKPSLQPHRRPTSSPKAPPIPSYHLTQSPTPAPPHADPPPPHSTRPLSIIAKYCYPFFLNHLHDPYPSPSQKQAIVNQANAPEVTLASVSTWFSNSRRRCGWVDICNEVCEADQRRMVEVCTRVFGLDQDQDQGRERVLSERDDEGTVRRILAMRERVRGWHEDQAKPSAWAVALYDLLQKFSDLDLDLERIDKTLVDSPPSSRSSSSGKKKTRKAPTLSPNKEFEPQVEDFELTPATTSISLVSELDSPGTIGYSLIVPDPEPLAGRKRLWVNDEDDDDKDTMIKLPNRCISMSSIFSESQSSESALSVESLPSLTWSTDDETRSSKRLKFEECSAVPCGQREGPSSSKDTFSVFLESPFTFTYPHPEPTWVATSTSVEQPMKRTRTHTSSEDSEGKEGEPSIKRIRLLDSIQPVSVASGNFSWPFDLPQGDASTFATPAQLSRPAQDAKSLPISTEENTADTSITTSLEFEFFNWDSYDSTDVISGDALTELLTNLTCPASESIIDVSHDSLNRTLNVSSTTLGAIESSCLPNQGPVKENDAEDEFFNNNFFWLQSNPELVPAEDEILTGRKDVQSVVVPSPYTSDNSNSTCGPPEHNILSAHASNDADDAECGSFLLDFFNLSPI